MCVEIGWNVGHVCTLAWPGSSGYQRRWQGLPGQMSTRDGCRHRRPCGGGGSALQSINSPCLDAAVGTTTPKLGSGPDKPPTLDTLGMRSGCFHLWSLSTDRLPPSTWGDTPVRLTFPLPHPSLGSLLRLRWGCLFLPPPHLPSSFRPLLYSPHPIFADEMALARGCAICSSEPHKRQGLGLLPKI